MFLTPLSFKRDDRFFILSSNRRIWNFNIILELEYSRSCAVMKIIFLYTLSMFFMTFLYPSLPLGFTLLSQSSTPTTQFFSFHKISTNRCHRTLSLYHVHRGDVSQKKKKLNKNSVRLARGCSCPLPKPLPLRVPQSLLRYQPPNIFFFPL